jgi:signal transduction histidine kinase
VKRTLFRFLLALSALNAPAADTWPRDAGSAAPLAWSERSLLPEMPWQPILGALFLAALAAALYLMRMRSLSFHAHQRMNTRLAERERIAGELHDTLLQSIYGVLLHMHALQDRVPDPELRRGLEEAIGRIESIANQARDRIAGLRDPMGLPEDLDEAIKSIAVELGTGTALKVSVHTSGPIEPLHVDVRDEILLIVREAIVNAVRHSDAVHVHVAMRADATGLALRIEDNGRGIPSHVLRTGAAKGHWGLSGMRGRAQRIGGTLAIEPGLQGGGTAIKLSLPGPRVYRRYDRRSFWRMRLGR